MATIVKRKNSNGVVYRVSIRKKGMETYKTFKEESDAKLYLWYKERLMDNMSNFEVPLCERITMDQIIEMKTSSLGSDCTRSISEFNNCLVYIKSFIPNKIFYKEYNYEDWLTLAKELLKTDVYRGAKTESAKRKMSCRTLRRIFASASSAVNFAIHKGINIENYPLKVMQLHINPLLKNTENDLEDVES